MPRYKKPVYDEFVAKFNSKLKPQSNDINKRPSLIYIVISPQITSISFFKCFQYGLI